MVKAVIFDMDGVMIDSEPIQSKAFAEVLKQYKKEPQYNEEGIVQTVGIRSRDNWERLKAKYNIDEETNILIEKRRQIYQKLLKSEIKPMPGLINFLKLLKKHNLKIAVASSSNIKHIMLVLSSLNIAYYFDVIVSGESVKKGKPYPDIFLETAVQLKITPVECLVLEDAELGVLAGKKAGMKVIAVPNKFTKKHDFSKADLIVDSLEKINWSIIKNLK